MLTGALEISTAALLAFPAGRIAGATLGAAIVVAAIVTVPRDDRHLLALGVFVRLVGGRGFVLSVVHWGRKLTGGFQASMVE